MSISKKFYSLALFLLALITMVGCAALPGVETFERSKPQAEADANMVAEKVFFSTEELNGVTGDLSFPTTSNWADRVNLTWTSSNEEVISNAGVVVRPKNGEGNVSVHVTLVVSAEYNRNEQGVIEVGTAEVKKEWDFVVLELPKEKGIADIYADIIAGNIKKGDEVIIKGTVVALNFKDYDDGRVYRAFINDGTAGMYAYISTTAKPGDNVTVKGNLDFYNSAYQLKGAKDSITIESKGNALPEPIKTSIAEQTKLVVEKNPLTGQLMNVNGTLVKEGTGKDTKWFLVDTNQDRFEIYYRSEFTYIPGAENAKSMDEVLLPFEGKYVNMTVIPSGLFNNMISVNLCPFAITEGKAPELTDEEKVNGVVNVLNKMETEYKAGETVDLLKADEMSGATVTWTAAPEGVIDVATGLIAENAKTQKVTLTATVELNKVSKVVTIEISVTELPKNGWCVTNVLDAKYSYKLGLVQDKLGKTLYLTGATEKSFLSTTENVEEAAEVKLVAVEGGYNIVVNGKLIALSSYQNTSKDGKVKTSYKLEYVETPTAEQTVLWTYDEAHNTFFAKCNNNTFFMGTYNEFTTISASNVSFIEKGNFISHLYGFMKDGNMVDPSEANNILLLPENFADAYPKAPVNVTIDGMEFSVVQVAYFSQYNTGIQFKKNLGIMYNTKATALNITSVILTTMEKCKPSPDQFFVEFSETADFANAEKVAVGVDNGIEVVVTTALANARFVRFSSGNTTPQFASMKIVCGGKVVELTDAEKLAKVAENLVKMDTKYVAGETVTLAKEDKLYGAQIVWTAAPEGIINLETGLILETAKAQVIKLTATLTLNKEVKEVIIEINVAEKPNGEWVVEEAPVAGTEYLFGMVQKNLDGQPLLFINGEMNGFYFATTEDASAAAKVVIEETAGGFYLKTNGQFMTIIDTGSHKNVKYIKDLAELKEGQTAVWTWNETAKCFEVQVNSTTKMTFGTSGSGSYNSASAVEISKNPILFNFYKWNEGTTPQPVLSDQEKLEADVKQFVTLPTTLDANTKFALTCGKYNSTIKYTSDNAALAIAEDGTVTITRGETDTVVNVKYVITQGTASSQEVTVQITVAKEVVEVLPEGTLFEAKYVKDSKVMPKGLEYIPNNPSYPKPSFYATGIKYAYIGDGFKTANFAAQKAVDVVLVIAALNPNQKEKGNKDPFTVYGLNAAGEVVATETLKTLVVGDNQVHLQGEGIVSVKVIMTDYFFNGTKCVNVNLSGVKVLESK